MPLRESIEEHSWKQDGIEYHATYKVLEPADREHLASVELLTLTDVGADREMDLSSLSPGRIEDIEERLGEVEHERLKERLAGVD